jgi:hypothetical protein
MVSIIESGGGDREAPRKTRLSIATSYRWSRSKDWFKMKNPDAPA